MIEDPPASSEPSCNRTATDATDATDADRIDRVDPDEGAAAERFPASGLLRAARRRADLSQRELARRANVSSSTVGRIEAGTLVPSLGILIRLLRVAGMRLVAIDAERRLVEPMHTFGGALDGADRRYPAHLDTILDPRMGEWWGDRFGLARPPETFRRDRTLRDAQRARSRWEVRVAQTRQIIPPPRIVPDGRPGRRL